MKICSNCQSQYNSNELFCQNCGTKLSDIYTHTIDNVNIKKNSKVHKLSLVFSFICNIAAFISTAFAFISIAYSDASIRIAYNDSLYNDVVLYSSGFKADDDLMFIAFIVSIVATVFSIISSILTFTQRPKLYKIFNCITKIFFCSMLLIFTVIRDIIKFS